jgi:hypothetical protein
MQLAQRAALWAAALAAARMRYMGYMGYMLEFHP